jgi:hypothetical protein
MGDDSGIKSEPGNAWVLVLLMAALVIAGGLVLYLGPDAIFPVIRRYPSLYGF